MAEFHEPHLKTALFHAKECVKCLHKAGLALGHDLDDELNFEEDYPPDPDPLLPGGAVEPNPQSGRRGAYLRLIKSAAAIKEW